MVKLRTGPPTAHVLTGHGPDVSANRFYRTRYSAEYGLENYKPRNGKHVGTGYSSNFRPQLYYSRSLDNLDNPVVGFILSDNYETVTKRHYRASRDSNGRDALPDIIGSQSESGFIRQRPLTVPVSFEVAKAFYDTKKYGGRSLPGISPAHKARLHTLKRHDPTEEENYFRGPQYMSTETKARFKGDPTAPLRIHQKDVGPLENTGFTDNKQIEPVTFNFDDPYLGNRQGAWCPTGVSITDTSFREWQDSDGRDPLPTIRERTSHETGFVRQKARHLYTHRRPAEAYLDEYNAPRLTKEQVKKSDPSEYLNMVHPHNKKSVTFAQYLGKQRPDRTEEELLGRVHHRDQELSGHSKNNYRYIETADNDVTRYLTNYNMRHFDREPKGVDREGWVMGGLQGPEEDGYRRDFKVHSFGKSVDVSERLRRLEPYVARSIKKRDVFYDDHTYDRKLNSSGTTYQKAISSATLVVPAV